jgi:hypothetical protein
MKRFISITLLMSAAACSGADAQNPESLGESSQDLNGALNPNGFLVYKNLGQGSVVTDLTLEINRKVDTDNYSDTTANLTGPAGTFAPNGTGKVIVADLPTIDAFFNKYFTTPPNVPPGSPDPNYAQVSYYNRGDLGLGRFMACEDRFDIDGQIACFVSNYAAGQDGSEFTFGMSNTIAFNNLFNNHPVATVAMVFRNRAPASQKILFMVYNAAGKLVNEAPLDRHGINFANEYNAEVAATRSINARPDPNVFGIPGTNLNDHIPSNCLNCHGGIYDAKTHTVTGAFFLPFDLDQFDFADRDFYRRADQLDSFRHLNQMVRRVAVAAGGTSITQQVDTWYGNTSHSPTLANQFNSSAVPSGWKATSADINVYRSVVRPFCRGCHMASASVPFDTAASFGSLAGIIQLDICQHKMPQSLQAQRLFWQSGQKQALVDYFRGLDPSSFPAAATAADNLSLCGPGPIITLDPQFVTTVP